MVALELSAEVADLYSDYVESLDEEQLERWPEFFIDDCLYKIVSRENHERGLPLALMLCESKAMLKDRVLTIRQTQMFAPRAMRHLLSTIRIKSADDEGVRVQANYAVLQTLVDEETRLFNVGRYLDLLVRENGGLKFKSKICVYDTLLIPNSLMYPL